MPFFECKNERGVDMSYDEFLEKRKYEDCRESYIEWREECCGFSYMKAIRDANDFEC